MTKEITLNDVAKSVDDLAIIIKEGFDGVDEKFDGVDEKFDGVDEKLEQATKEREALKRDMDEIKMKFAYTTWQIDVEDLKKRMVKVEQKVEVKY